MRVIALLFAALALPAIAAGAEPVAAAPPLANVDPVPPAELEAAIDRGVQFLLRTQNADGSWGTGENTKGLNILASVPGSHRAFRSAVTGLCVSALCEVGGDSAAVKAAVDRAEAWLCEHLPKLRRASPMELYNVWGHAYAIDAFVHLVQRHTGDAPRQAELKRQIAIQVELLNRYETVFGGWGYYDFNAGTQKPSGDPASFTTATCLVALHNARSVGVEVPQKLIDRGLAAILRMKKPDLSFIYGEYLKYVPQHGVNQPGGSLGRTQACGYCLRLYGDKSFPDATAMAWLDRLFARNGWLAMGRKRPVPHESWFAVAGYFYYYGHYYTAHTIDLLPERERPRYRAHLGRIIVPLQEKDGSWWDFPFYNYHPPYGTAFALMTLKRCREATPAAPAP